MQEDYLQESIILQMAPKREVRNHVQAIPPQNDMQLSETLSKKNLVL